MGVGLDQRDSCTRGHLMSLQEAGKGVLFTVPRDKRPGFKPHRGPLRAARGMALECDRLVAFEASRNVHIQTPQGTFYNSLEFQHDQPPVHDVQAVWEQEKAQKTLVVQKARCRSGGPGMGIRQVWHAWSAAGALVPAARNRAQGSQARAATPAAYCAVRGQEGGCPGLVGLVHESQQRIPTRSAVWKSSEDTC